MGTRRDGASRLREDALSAWRAGVAAGNPRRAVSEQLRSKPLEEPDRTLVLATGKAAAAMVAAVPEPTRGFALIPTGTRARDVPAAIEILSGGHPVPSPEGFAASRRILSAARSLSEGDSLLYLVSGGTSALFEVPRAGLADADVARVYELLLGSGAPIEQMNAVRSALSEVKRGGLARAAYPARVRTLAVSDVIGDDPAVIGSGPTVNRPVDPAEAVTVLERCGLWSRVPEPVRRWLAASPPPAAGPARSGEVEIVVGMDSAAEAARAFLAARGYDLVAPPLARLEGDGTVAAEKIARFLLELAGRARAAFVLAGETTLRLPDRVGLGGRNQHLAALVARRLDGVGGVAFVAGGTDGIDGNSDAAGAVVDGTTASRARRAGADLDRAIEAFDTHTALAAAGATLTPGPTGTNLGDLVVGISGAPA